MELVDVLRVTRDGADPAAPRSGAGSAPVPLLGLIRPGTAAPAVGA